MQWESLQKQKTMIRKSFSFVGFENYIRILTDPDFWTSFGHSLVWTIFSVIGQVIIGFIGALCLNRIKSPAARSIFRIAAIIPWAFPSIATAMTWKWLFNGIYGFIPEMLQKLGLTDGLIQFFSDPSLVLPALIFINIWFGAPLILVNVYAALQTIPQDQYEAAQILGYSKFETFFIIILPQVFKIILPSVTNEVITLVKDTSLSFVIAIPEMFTVAKQIAAAEASIMALLVAGVFYYVFNMVVAFVMEYLEKRLDYYQ